MIKRDGDVFILETKNTMYLFRLMKTGHLEHLYYGKKIRWQGGILPLIEKKRFIGGNHISYSKEHPHLGLEDVCLEMSSLGKGDIREPLLELTFEDGSTTCDFIFKESRILDQKVKLSTLPSAYVSQGDSICLEIDLEERNQPVILTLVYTVFYDSDVITRSVSIKNCGTQPIDVRRLLTIQLDMDHHQYKVSSFHGAWAREMNRCDHVLTQGMIVNDSKAGVSSSRCNPFMMVSGLDTTEEYGDCYGFNLIYSGNHYEAVEVSSTGKTRILSGINPSGFSYLLEENEILEAPEGVMTYSREGYTGMSHNMHHFIRNHIVRGKWQWKERPVLLNSWEGNYFKFNEAKIMKQAVVAKKAGIELFVLDDGWFGKRDDDTSSLGDWYVNQDKLKHGLGGLAKKINDLGMDFGIWVEPEMVNENSELYRKHPDWAVKIPNRDHSLGRNQMLLDLTRVEVQDYIIEAMTEVFSSANISYVKWDMNRIITDIYSHSLEARRMKEFVHRYYVGLYRILECLTTRFPDVLFESCASGGNRFDLGMLCYMPQVWASDNTDAICRVKMQTGYSYGYPMSVVGAHVSSCPNHQTLRNTPLETRFEVAAFGLLGYECNLAELAAEELDIIQKQIAYYKQYRNTLQYGVFYRIKNDDHGVYQWLTVDTTGDRALGLYLQKEVIANSDYGKFVTRGLLEDQIYRMTNRQKIFNIKEFGDLINMISPIHIKKDSLLHNIIAKVKKMPGEVEDCCAYGDVFNHAGIKLSQGFAGVGYDETTRLFQDYASRLYDWNIAIQDKL